ncbi:MAG: phosphoenolpyruvate--protein phosphotransferase, partial [Opitutaceae bacterium]|nr:phosphoenolpyruvate--protein phosphotransferase [Opitutaceae bacterium]
ARSMKVPAVVGLRDATSRLQSGDWVIVDGYEGLVIVRPSEETLTRYGKMELEHKSFEKKLLSNARLPAKTQDGKEIKLLANIESADEAISAQETGADGVGLFRTEFLFLGTSEFPDEEQQFSVYKKVAEIFKSQPVIIRTLDLGGDKALENETYFSEQEANPFLGFRAIRFCLEHTDIFKNQLRAILRASAFGNVKVMYPMISGPEELIRANILLDEAKEELRVRGEGFDEEMSVGSMIEIPSAAIIGDLLAKECDFFSIGTNDLIQYLFAIDRLNDRVAHLYEPTHLGVLRTIKSIIDTGHSNKIEVGICGEMAGDPVLVPLLIGLGADELSVSPSGIPAVKYLTQNMEFSEAVQLAETALACSSAKEIYAQAKAFYEKKMGEANSL